MARRSTGRPFRRSQILLRRWGPSSLVWRRRVAVVGGAVAIGLAALVFAALADAASRFFLTHVAPVPWLPLLLTPAAFAAIQMLTARFAPAAAGSGIPQIIAARTDPAGIGARLTALPVALLKMLLTAAALMVGASVGREGPTVQVGGAVMAVSHRLMRVQVSASALIAGGAAGVAAAFNTPLAGVAFAIEELAAAYEQRMTMLVMTAVLVAGMTSLGIAGDYLYFGLVGQTLSLSATLVLAPLVGVLGGVAGTGFARAMLWLTGGGLSRLAGGRPAVAAAACGLVVAIVGVATGLTWGTGYDPTRDLLAGTPTHWWFGPAKFLSTLATAVAGIPGGIFAPSLATGAGLSNMLLPLFPGQPAGAIVLLGMVAYFTGVVRAPLTAVIIVAETTGSRGLMLPLLAAALIAEFTASALTRERLYHALAQRFLVRG